jgi:hypothetical protein
MRWCGKKSFTRLCKAFDFYVEMRSGCLPGRIFLWRGERAFLQGVLRKNSVFVWCFCGEVVVGCW